MRSARRGDLRPATPAEAPDGARGQCGEAKPAERALAIEAPESNTNEPLQAAVGVRLDTPRLRLRPHSVEDFEALATLWADPAVTRFIGGRPATREESWGRLLRYAGLWRLLGFGYWAVEDRETGAYLGDVGFADFHRPLDPAPPALPEMGWVLSPAVHGKGLATEAAAAALAWLGRDCFCMIDPAHAGSLRVAAKLGFVQVGVPRYRDGVTTLLIRRH